MYPLPKEKRAKIFKNGRSRAVRIPLDFELEGDEVLIRQESDGVITIRPAGRNELEALLANLSPLAEKDRMPEMTDDDLLPLPDAQF